MRSFLSDVRFGLRGLARNPGFAFVAVATLALGIGATVTVFGVADAALLRPLPYPQSERLLRVGSLHPVKNADGIGASYLDFRDWRVRSHSFSELGGVLESSAVLGGSEGADRVTAVWISSEVLPALRLEPLLGRNFRADEDRESGDTHVAMLSASLWKTRFGSDRSVLGRKILVEGNPYEIVGVAPDDELFLGDAGLLIPLVNQAFAGRSGRAIDVVGRLAPGVSISAARGEMASIGRALAREYPEEETGFSVVVAPLHDSLLGGRRPALLVLSGAVALLLLIACANTANLLLARGASRRRELAVRAALGARRSRLARQLVTEAAALALVGGAAGLGVASSLLALIRRTTGSSLPRIESAGIDGRTALFAVAASAATVLLFGAIPAILASGRAMAAGLRGPGRGTGGERPRLLDGLVLFQTALCVVLLVAAGLLGESYVRLARTPMGFTPERVLAADISLPRGVYNRDPARRTEFLERAAERVAALPGVRAAGITGWLPSQGSMTMSFHPEAHPSLSRAESPQAELREITSGTFAALGVPVLEGRGVAGGDRAESTPVIVLNRRLAEKLWPGRSAVGMHVTLFIDKVDREVVGVVGDVKRLDRGAQSPDQMYVPLSQDPLFIGAWLVARSEGDPEALGASIERVVRDLDPGVAVSQVSGMSRVLAGNVAEPRLRTALIGFFAAAALTLASIGLYGVIAYAVARRRYEIGVRVAMGATPSEILRLFVGGGLRLAAVGVAAGIAAAAVAARLLSGLLYGIRPLDPLTFAAAALVLFAVAFVATFVPARRAAATDPLQALRSD